MLVFWKEKLVLFAVPKTGTTALEGHLAPRASLVLRDPPTVKHTPVYRYNRFLLPYFETIEDGAKFETIACVRHPESWLGSWYRYRHRDELVGHRNSTRGLDFETFVDGYLSDPRPSYAQVGSQAKFLIQKQEIAVDHLYQYEQMDKLIAFLEDRLRKKIDLPKLNVSPPMDLSLSQDMREKLQRKARREYRVWNAGHREG